MPEFHVCDPVPLAIAQLLVSERQAPLSMWKPVLQLVGAHVSHVVEPSAQLCDPVPLVMVQARDPEGLLHACESTDAPHTAESVGVHA